MGSKRVGLARVQALIENLKRELNLEGTQINGATTKESVEVLNTVGTVATPTKSLTAADSGKTFFVDISTVSIVATLPAPEAGLHYKFVLSVASDNEATKDFLLNTHADSTDINGSVIVNGAHVEVTNATSAVALDSTTGVATVGDFFEVDCDGTDWYIRGVVKTASAVVINDAKGGFTPA